MEAPPLTIFCDFDGTITERDMVVTICQRFCPPGWERIKDDILARRLAVKDGVAQLFAMIPSSEKAAIIRYAQEQVRWRAGFSEFLTFCQEQGIRFIVCSGGIDFFVEPLMAPFLDKIEKVISIPSDFSGPTIQLRHTDACETCGTCKAKIMARYRNTISILIGDSVTDVHGAKAARLVFARNGLQDYLKQDGIAFYPFETFFDIQKQLESFKGHPHEKEHASTAG
jgi:2-hydroxy-3-keto-5-methylthiopentenyl-1-phosphate phosphatase